MAMGKIELHVNTKIVKYRQMTEQTYVHIGGGQSDCQIQSIGGHALSVLVFPLTSMPITSMRTTIASDCFVHA